MLRSARSSWLEARSGCSCFQPAASSHTTTTQASAPARTRSTLGLTATAPDRCCCARNITSAAPTLPALLGPLCTTARTRRFSLFHIRPHTLLPLPVIVSPLARRPSFSSSELPPFFLAGRSFFLLASRCAARRAARMHARLLASARTTDERTMRRADRRRG